MTITNVTSTKGAQPANTVQPGNSQADKPNAGAATSDVSTSTNNTASSTTAASTNSAPASSTVSTLSTISTQLQAAQASSSSDAVFSTSKVNEIKQAISEGRFQVNSEKVANGLLDSVHDLLGSRRH